MTSRRNSNFVLFIRALLLLTLFLVASASTPIICAASGTITETASQPVPLDKTWLKISAPDGVPTLVLSIPTNITYRTTSLDSPKRFVLDLLGAKLPSQSLSIDLPWSMAKRYRVSQMTTSIVRLVLDLNQPVLFNVSRQRVTDVKDKLIVTACPSLLSVDVGADDGSIGPMKSAAAVVKLSMSSAVSFKLPPNVPSSAIHDKEKVTIEIPNSWTNLEQLRQGWGPVTSVGLANSPEGSKVVLELAGDLHVDYQVSEAGNEILVYLYPKFISTTVVDDGRTPGEVSVVLKTSYPLSTSGVNVFAEEPDKPLAKRVHISLVGVSIPDSPTSYSTNDSSALVSAVDVLGNTSFADAAISLFHPTNYRWEMVEEGYSIKVTFSRLPLTGKSIVLDPGHGGTDPGAIGSKSIPEKKITLDVAIQVAKLLTELGVNVMMTRDTDVFIPLGKRASFQMDSTPLPDAFLSIHVNSFATTKGTGTETWYSKSAHARSEALARAVQRSEIAALKLPDRGVKTDDRLAVTRNRTIPSALHEIGFVSNPGDEAIMTDPSWQAIIAAAIRDGLVSFLMEANQ